MSELFSNWLQVCVTGLSPLRLTANQAWFVMGCELLLAGWIFVHTLRGPVRVVSFVAGVLALTSVLAFTEGWRVESVLLFNVAVIVANLGFMMDLGKRTLTFCQLPLTLRDPAGK